MFDNWVKDSDVVRKTSKILHDEDIVTPDVIASMNVQELRSLGVSYGQATLLVATAAKTLKPEHEVPVASKTASSVTVDIPVNAASTITTDQANIGAQSATLAAAGRQYDQLFGVNTSVGPVPAPETKHTRTSARKRVCIVMNDKSR